MEDPQSSSAESDDRSLKTAESLRAFREHADQTLQQHRERQTDLENRINELLQLIADELTREKLADEQSAVESDEQAALIARLQETLQEKEAEIEEVLDQLAAQSLEFEAQLGERDGELEELLELLDSETRQRESLEQDRDSGQHELDALAEQRELLQKEIDVSRQAIEERSQQCESLQGELESARQALEELRAEACGDCVRKSSELSTAHQRLEELNEQHRTLQEQFDTCRAERDESQSALQEVQSEQEHATASLKEAQATVAELNQQVQHAAENEEQLEQTRRKFELALADVHKLKRENSELHEELLSRPAADAQESPELVSLRAERDALAERVAELQNSAPPASEADGQQELADLQRRFELAVDDVRQLKQENADLHQKLETRPTASAPVSSDEPQDWQAQRARLMAALDAEEQGGVDEPRREERATVEGTIQITDRVVAEKDAAVARLEAELKELRTELESRPAGPDLEELRDQIAAEVLGDDESVQAEVEKLQQKQQQLEGKLREAELEISVQRATLAREQAALEEKLARLPEEREQADDQAPDKPRRRWLSALGISDEEKP